MALTPGTRVGHYEIVSPLGAGGMGEVYRARDTQLKRDVALKVLPAEVATDPERLARFQREAELLAALNHPHIAQIYGVAEADGVRALVMELVDGPTLAERIAQGPVPVAEALPIARQLADALDEAHERGIVHRDLKPANIKLSGAWGPTPTRLSDGHLAPTRSATDVAGCSVKVLDFGLAKALGADATAETAELSTMTSPAETQAGIILGTAAYMSPEQARGRAVDKRADIWAFGVVLYEMLTGAKSFPGDTITDVLGAIVHKEPDWTLLPADTPAEVRALMRSCLEKEPRRRLRDIADGLARLDSPSPAEDSSARPTAPATSTFRRWVRDPRSMAALVIGGIGLTLGTVALIETSVSTKPEWAHVSITLPETMKDVQPTRQLFGFPLALSPDDRYVAFGGTREGTDILFLRAIDSFDVIEVAQDGRMPFFKPDGRALGFMRGGEVWRTPLDRPLPAPVGRIPAAEWNYRDALWHPAGDILVTTDRGLYRISENGGEATLAIPVETGNREAFYALSLLSDGRVMVAIEADDGVGLGVVDVGTWTITRKKGVTGSYVRGWLFTPSPNGLAAARFDERRLSVAGESVVIAGTPTSAVTRGRATAISNGGSTAWLTSPLTPSALTYVDQSGHESSLEQAAEEPLMRWPRLSPDGKRLAYGRVGEGSTTGCYPMEGSLEVLDLVTGARTRLDRVGQTEPVWMPGGTALVAATGSTPCHGLALLPTDGRAGSALFAKPPTFEVWPTSISSDGSQLVYYVNGAGADDGLYAMNLETRESTPLFGRPGVKGARFSPDGRWIAYQVLVNDRYQVEVVSWPTPDARHVVSSEGSEPLWSADGRRLFFRGESDIMAADVLPGAGFSTAPPKALFPDVYLEDPYGDQSWDLAPGGRFLMLKPAPTAPLEVRMIRNVVGWLEQQAQPGG
jgi:serine/threonine protein kinase